MENLGKIDIEEEAKKRERMVYIPNWFTVDLKLGVSLLVFSYLFVRKGAEAIDSPQLLSW